MSRRARFRSFGGAGVLVLAGAILAEFASGVLGQAFGIGLITVGLGAALLLLFAEVGFSEDRERAREAERRRNEERKPPPPHEDEEPRPGRWRPRRRPG